MVYSLLASLLVKDSNVSRSTLEQTRAIYFSDVKIPATNRFSKCETCEMLKKMLHAANIEASHDLREEDFEKLKHDNVTANSLTHCRSTINCRVTMREQVNT